MFRRLSGVASFLPISGEVTQIKRPLVNYGMLDCPFVCVLYACRPAIGELEDCRGSRELRMRRYPLKQYRLGPDPGFDVEYKEIRKSLSVSRSYIRTRRH